MSVESDYFASGENKPNFLFGEHADEDEVDFFLMKGEDTHEAKKAAAALQKEKLILQGKTTSVSASKSKLVHKWKFVADAVAPYSFLPTYFLLTVSGGNRSVFKRTRETQSVGGTAPMETSRSHGT